MTRPAPLPPSLAAAMARAEAEARGALPAGPGRTLVESRCAPCHSVAIVVQQRKTPEGWTKSLTQMRVWGARIDDDDQAVLLAYLTTHFRADETR